MWSTEQCLAYSKILTPPPPLHPASVSSPRTKGGGVHTRRAVRGWGVNILEDARHWIGLLQYNPSTAKSNSEGDHKFLDCTFKAYREFIYQGSYNKLSIKTVDMALH
jgi:hypothetical protein